MPLESSTSPLRLFLLRLSAYRLGIEASPKVNKNNFLINSFLFIDYQESKILLIIAITSTTSTKPSILVSLAYI